MDTAKKILLVILDGASDRPVNGKTPLQLANTPNLDRIASMGISGIMDPIAPGIRPGSDVAHLALLGYDPYEVYTGRGPFEAAGAGIPVKKGDIAFRCNFATKRDDVIADRRAGRIRETGELVRAIQGGVHLDVTFMFEKSAGHRAALAFRSKGLDPNVSDSDPKYDGEAVRSVRALKPEAERTARILNEFTRQAESILERHPLNAKRIKAGKPPANTILIRGAGMVPDIKTFSEKYGLKGAVIAAAALVIGIGKICGLNYIETKGATGGVDSNIDAKVKNAIDALKKHDFVLLSIKGTDEASHDGDIERKTKFISKIDDALAPIVDMKDTIVVVTADHSTPVAVRDHSADPVPVMIAGPGVRADNVCAYDEVSAATGGLNRIRSINLMPMLLDLINRTEKFGA